MELYNTIVIIDMKSRYLAHNINPAVKLDVLAYGIYKEY